MLVWSCEEKAGSGRRKNYHGDEGTGGMSKENTQVHVAGCAVREYLKTWQMKGEWAKERES